MRGIVVADTGPLVALLDGDDAWHDRVRDWLTTTRSELVVAEPVLAEVCYLAGRHISPLAEIAFVESLARGEFVVEPLVRADLPRVAQLVKRYHDMPLGYVDATVIAIAERLGARGILTTDRRHFGAVRDKKGRAFALLP